MLDPERAQAIALATGTDPIVPASETSETGLVEIVSDPSNAAPVATLVSDTKSTEVESPPLVEDTTTHLAIVEAEERARAAERRSHRSIVVPRTSTPHCARTCQPLWERCTAACTADQIGCVSACRRELSICSRGCY